MKGSCVAVPTVVAVSGWEYAPRVFASGTVRVSVGMMFWAELWGEGVIGRLLKPDRRCGGCQQVVRICNGREGEGYGVASIDASSSRDPTAIHQAYIELNASKVLNKMLCK